MASYAALVSLMNVLNRVRHPTCPASFNNSQMESLFEKVSILVEFLENYSQRAGKCLEVKLTDAASSAEDTMESYVVEQILARSTGNGCGGYAYFCQVLEKVIQEMDLLIQEAMKAKEKNVDEMDQLPRSSTGLRSSEPPGGLVKVVGLENEVEQLKERICTNKLSREILPVVGMGGIGKTTLTRTVYNIPYVRRYFEVQAWVTISQDYKFGEIIRPLLKDIGVDEPDCIDDDESLGDKLYKCLFRIKYLIVLDDIWDSNVWVEIRRFFPDNENGSRIVLTTRLLEVAGRVGSCSPYEVKLLDHAKSWNLFCEVVFGLNDFPSELDDLEVCGEKIVKSCKGLPLAIVVAGGLLKTCQKRLKFWQRVARDATSFITAENDSHCLEMLSLSYNHLPVHLKPCFLYMGTFKEDSEIGISNLIKLWVADGFLKPTGDQTFEEVALQNLKGLIDRNLVTIRQHGSRGGIKSCAVHDLVRELCLREAQTDKFLCLVKKEVLNEPKVLGPARRLACHQHFSHFNYCFPSFPMARSMFCDFSPQNLSSGCRLLRVLSATESDVDGTQLLNLRYIRCVMKPSILNSSIALLWNIETLIFEDEELILPGEIWDLQNLRHLELGGVLLPNPVGLQKDRILHNLQTIKGIKNFHCTDEVLAIIPNVKKLSVSYDVKYLSDDSQLSLCFTNVARLHSLETLFCSFDHYSLDDVCVFRDPNNFTLPHSLKKLVLSSCNMPWESMTIIGSLPNLEVLKIMNDAFCGEEWSSEYGEFESLVDLTVYKCSLRTWNIESSHFPKLKGLSLWCFDLEEIPLCIAEVDPLVSISLGATKISAVASAKTILEKAEMEGNNELSVDVQYLYRYEHEKAEVKSMENDKFKVEYQLDYLS